MKRALFQAIEPALNLPMVRAAIGDKIRSEYLSLNLPVPFDEWACNVYAETLVMTANVSVRSHARFQLEAAKNGEKAFR